MEKKQFKCRNHFFFQFYAIATVIIRVYMMIPLCVIRVCASQFLTFLFCLFNGNVF